MTRIGFKICYAWKNSIYETPSPILEGVSDSRQIKDLGYLLKYILFYCSTQKAKKNIEKFLKFKYILCYCSTSSCRYGQG